MKKRNKRIFKSLIKQLKYEVMFVKNVCNPYYNFANKVDIVDFEYRGMPCRLVLNGKLMLETGQGKSPIGSYHDLVQGLIQSNYPQKKVGLARHAKKLSMEQTACGEN